MESTQVLECTQVLDSYSGNAEERAETSLKVGTLTIEGVEYTIWNRENTIGRDARCSIVLNNKAVSVEHAVIEADSEGGHFICDLGSTNKTKLGDLQLKPRVKYFINDGDSLKIANVKGVYRHVRIATDPIPPESSTPPMAELTAIPGTPERKEEEDAVASIIAETPCKDEGNGADSSDGDIFGEPLDSSALFVRPLKLPTLETKLYSECRIDAGELPKTDGSSGVERVGSPLLEDPKNDASIYAVASQSIVADQSNVLKGDEAIDDSSFCDADSSDLVAGSQPMLAAEKRLYDPKFFECDTVPPEALNFEDELTEPPNRCDQWENIDDSITEISNQMDTIDSLVENKRLQVTYTPPKRKADMPGSGGIGSACKPNDRENSPRSIMSDDEADSPSSSPNVKKFNKNKIVRSLEEGLDAPAYNDDCVKADFSKSDQKSGNVVISGNDDKHVSVYELETQDMGDVSSMKVGGAPIADSSVDSTDKSGGEDNLFDVDTVPMEYGGNDRGLSNLNIFDLATQQIVIGDKERHRCRDNPNIYDAATQPFAVPDSNMNDVHRERTLANGPKAGKAAKVSDREKPDVSISDFPTQPVPCKVDPPHDKLLDQKPESVLEDAKVSNCDVSLSAMATQAVPVKTNCDASLIYEISMSDLPTQTVEESKNEEHFMKLTEKVEGSCDDSISDMATQAVSVLETNRELSSMQETSISDMPTQVVNKNLYEERLSKLAEEEEEPCDVSISNMATQQVSVHRTVQMNVVSTTRNLNLSDPTVEPSRVFSESECKVPSSVNAAQKNQHHDPENIYNVLTQLPVESNLIVLEESNTQLINSEVQKASHDVSISDMLTQPSKVESDDTSEIHDADVSLSDLATQAAVTKSDELSRAEQLKKNMIDQDTEDIFNAMTQLPVGNDEILLEVSDSQFINSEVQKAQLDISLSDMMTQPTKSTSGVTRGRPVVEISTSDLPTRATTAKIDSFVHQDSEDIYDVMTQMPVENEKILLDESDTQQINADLENCESKMVDSALKQLSGDRIGLKFPDDVPSTVSSTFITKQNPTFKIPTPKKGLKKVDSRKRDNIDVFMMETQPMDFQTSVNSDPADNIVPNEENTVTKSLPIVVLHGDDSASNVSISALVTQEATNVLPKDPVTGKDVNDGDIFELDTVPIDDATDDVKTEDEVVARSSEKETNSGKPRIVSSTQDHPNSVEGRIRAMSDKNVNSFATQQILVASNTKSTVAELLETLEDASSQVVRTNRKVKRLHYSDSEDSHSPVIRPRRKGKALAESDNEEDTDSPLIVKKKHNLPLNDSDEEEGSLQGELKKYASESKIESDVLCNGNNKHSTKSPQEDAHTVIALPVVDESLKNTISEPVQGDISSGSVKSEKDTADNDSKIACSSEVVKGGANTSEKVGGNQTAVIENTERAMLASSNVAETLPFEKEENVGTSTANCTEGSEPLQLQVSADVSLNKSNVVSTPTTPEKQSVVARDVTPSTHEQNEIPKPSPETPEIPKDFFGTPVFHDKPVLRQYVNRKKLSLSSTSLLKGPNASSTPKSDIDSASVIEMEETLHSAKASGVKTYKDDEKAADAGYSTPKNVKKFQKASPQKRKSPEVVEQHSQESDFLSSQEFDSQEFGRGKRKKQKKSFFGFVENERLDSFTVISFRKDHGSVQDTQKSELSTSSLRSAAMKSPADENNMDSGAEANRKKNMKDEVLVKRHCASERISSESSSLKKLKVSSEVESENRLSDKESVDMELTGVRSSRLQEDAEETVTIVKKFRRASPRKPEPVRVEEISKTETDVKSFKSSEILSNVRGRRRNVSTSESDSGKEASQSRAKKADSSKSAGISSAASPSTSPMKSLRSRKRNDVKKDTKSATETVSSQKGKRNRVQNRESSQEISDPVDEGDSSQEISIKSMSERLQGALRNKMQLEEVKITQKLKPSERNRRNSGSKKMLTLEDVNVGEGNARKESVEVNILGSTAKRVGPKRPEAEEIVGASSNIHVEPLTSRVQSPKKEVKQRRVPRKRGSPNEQTIEKAEVPEENVPNPEPNKSNVTVSTRWGRRKQVNADVDSVAIGTSENDPIPASLEVSAPKRGRKAKTENTVRASNDVADTKFEVTESSDSQNAPCSSKSKSSVSKTRGHGRNTPAVEDSLTFDTDQNSQSDLSQGRRSGRARKKKESFDDIMSRKEEELRLKKLQRSSTLSPSSDKSRSTSRASVASSSKTEDTDGAVMSAPKRRGRPKKSASVTSSSTVMSIDDDATFNVPASIPSPAGSNSSRRKTSRPGSASSSNSVESQASTKKKQENSTSLSIMKVMFTGLADSRLSSMVKKLGGRVVEEPTDCTVLVTDKVRRTVKFLCALGLGKPIVSPNWLSKSKAFNKFADPNDSLLKDSEAESKFDFQLNGSLKKAQNSRLLEGYSFYATTSVLPPPSEIKSIIECSGGTYLAKPPAKWGSNAAIISTPKDKSGWTKLSKHGVLPPILSAEALLSGVLQQQFDLCKHRL